MSRPRARAVVFVAAVACSSPHPGGPAATPDAPRADAGAADAAATTDAGSSADAGTCGTRTGMRGMTQRSVVVDGATRTYSVYLPATADPTAAMPFVYVFHGYTMSGSEMADITEYAALADQYGIGVVFPDGESGPDSTGFPWDVENPGQTVCGLGQYATASGDDFAFIDAMKADVANDQCLDAKHLFATGFSMGGYFTEHVGCYRSDFRALAPASGGTIGDLSPCTTAATPIILFHGAADPYIADACDDPTASPISGFPAAATLWAARNGCAATYTTVPTTGSGGGSGQCYVYDGCPAGAQVELCTFTGMDHCWAGGNANDGNSCPSYANATALEWSFFQRYAW